MPLKLSRDSQTREQPYGGVVICGVFLGLTVGVVVDRKTKTRVSTGSEKWGLLSRPSRSPGRLETVGGHRGSAALAKQGLVTFE